MLTDGRRTDDGRRSDWYAIEGSGELKCLFLSGNGSLSSMPAKIASSLLQSFLYCNSER